MPEPLHPPYLPSATQQPRTLDRWLDINSQNGPLTRIQTFITIPQFAILIEAWHGYSEIVGAFNFEAPNNFSFLQESIQMLEDFNSTFTLCVMFVNVDMSVTRYSLNRSASDLFFFQLIPYTGQLIKKNFRLEIWNNANSSRALNPIFGQPFIPINIYTSVLGTQDYRYGIDSVLALDDGLVSNFSVNLDSGAFDLPIQFPLNSVPQPNLT